MSRKTRIVAVENGQPVLANASVIEESGESPTAVEAAWEDGAAEPTQAKEPWGAAVVAACAVIAWTVFFAWTNRALFPIATPAQWTSWISLWSTPVMLIGVAWLIAMRNSRREAARFGEAARALREEAAALETRLLTVNQELSLAREFIAAQARDLDSLGRTATDRISQHASRLQDLIHNNGEQVAAIGNVSEAALDNMERLRGQLPVIASSAKDVTNNIGNAGMAAQVQLQELVTGFNRLNEFGLASERQVAAILAQIDDAIAAFTKQAGHLGDICAARFATLEDRSQKFRATLDSHEVEALAAIRTRAAALAEELTQTRSILDGHEAESLNSLRARLVALRDEGATIGRSLRETETAALAAWRDNLAALDTDMRTAIQTLEAVDRQAMATARLRLNGLLDEATRLEDELAERNRHFEDEIAKRRAEAQQNEEAATHSLAQRLEALDEMIAARRAAYEDHARAMLANAEALGAQLAEIGARIRDAAGQGSEAEARIASALARLTDNLAQSSGVLDGTDAVVNALTDSSVRLLELIQASARHSREDLTQAIASGEERLNALEAQARDLGATVGAATANGDALSAHAAATRETLGAVVSLQDEIAGRTDAQQRAIAAVREDLLAVRHETETLARAAQDELGKAIADLSTAARDAVGGIEAMSADAVAAVAQQLGAESGIALEKVMRVRAAEVAGQLELAAAHAAGISREAAMQLRDQLTKVDELAGNLERRVIRARERAEEQVDNDFARRAALITESLNSNAIDIAKALDTDVSDSAWAAYLRGDRGIFTRRAVRLVDAADAKAIAQTFENDSSFREHVSHYIHDFEAMLRQLLSTRDGHALGVTLLSSDMGKLYVALAQAIERLRN